MNGLHIGTWSIRNTDPEHRAFAESIFSLGNGYMGTRGYRPDRRGEHPAWRSTFVSGFYEYVKPGITDLVNQPDFSALQFSLNGADSETLLLSDYTQTLDLRCGLLRWDYRLTDADGHVTHVRQEKFLSMADRHLAALRLTLTAENWSGEAEIETGIDAGVMNLPIADDQLTQNTEFFDLWSEVQVQEGERGSLLTAKTRISGRETVMGYCLSQAGSTERAPRAVATRIRRQLAKGVPWALEKLVCCATYRDADPMQRVRETLCGAETNFELRLRQSAAAWEEIWQDTDVELEGNDEWQGAIRYNIFQLVQAMPSGDSRASIGARGLTHGRYKGCYFWDTEIFMLPMFLWTRPEDAESLLGYRYHTLPDAMESAERFSAKGARYSWMSSDTGFEQCESWDTGCCEIHITADIAYAFYRYNSVISGEKMRNQSAEVLTQTARYWVDRFNYSAKEDRYHLLFVKGPDEYGGVTTDDFYTVCMARDNLQYAAQYVRALPARHLQALVEKTGLTSQEPALWEEIARKVVLVRDGLLWRQDSTFDYLEPMDIAAAKTGDVPLYRTISFDRLQRYQVLKQPDVLMYMALRPECFSDTEVRAAWAYYEPRTLHDSTLSFGIHALLAARYGFARATEYFEKSLFLDLKNIMGNTANEGIHTAALGATWQAMVLGIGGLEERGGALHVSDHLPETLTAMRYRVQWHGTRYEIRLRRGEAPSVQKL